VSIEYFNIKIFHVYVSLEDCLQPALSFLTLPQSLGVSALANIEFPKPPKKYFQSYFLKRGKCNEKKKKNPAYYLSIEYQHYGRRPEVDCVFAVPDTQR